MKKAFSNSKINGKGGIFRRYGKPLLAIAIVAGLICLLVLLLPPFWDVPWWHEAYPDTQQLWERKLLRETHGLFHPNDKASIDDALSILCRVHGMDDNALEEDKNRWYLPDRAYAVCQGWCTETEADNGGESLTWAMTVQLLSRALFPGNIPSPPLSAMTPEMQMAVERGWMPDKEIDWNDTLTRAELAQVTCNALPPVPQKGDSVQVPILMYHDVSYLGYGYSITPELFRTQMQELKDAGFHTVWYSQLVDYVKNGTPLPEKPFVLTLDDGYRTNYEYVLPILKEFDLKAEISLVGAAMEYSDWGLYWAQVEEMAASGLVSFQSHTWAMHEDYSASGGRNGSLKLDSESWPDYLAALLEDQSTAIEKIEAHTGKRPIVFTYPMGRWNSAADALMVHSLGYEVTVITWDSIPVITQGDMDSLRLMDRIGMDFSEENKSVLQILSSYGYAD